MASHLSCLRFTSSQPKILTDFYFALVLKKNICFYLWCQSPSPKQEASHHFIIHFPNKSFPPISLASASYKLRSWVAPWLPYAFHTCSNASDKSVGLTSKYFTSYSGGWGSPLTGLKQMPFPPSD